jgi:hypothetical protein
MRTLTDEYRLVNKVVVFAFVPRASSTVPLSSSCAVYLTFITAFVGTWQEGQENCCQEGEAHRRRHQQHRQGVEICSRLGE